MCTGAGMYSSIILTISVYFSECLHGAFCNHDSSDLTCATEIDWTFWKVSLVFSWYFLAKYETRGVWLKYKLYFHEIAKFVSRNEINRHLHMTWMWNLFERLIWQDGSFIDFFLFLRARKRSKRITSSFQELFSS